MMTLRLPLAMALLLIGGGLLEAADDLPSLVREYESLMGLRDDQGYGAQQEVLERIADCRTPEARAALQTLLTQYGRADRRRAALLLAALVRRGSPRDIDKAITWVERESRDPLLLELLHRVLAGAQEPAARAWLRTDALKKATPRVKAQIVRALAEQGDSVNVLPLLKLLREPVLLVRMETLEALGRLQATNAIAFIEAFLQDEDYQLRDAAARALGRIGDKRGVACLRKALEDPVPRVAESAAYALGRIGDAEPIPDLIRGLARHKKTDLRLADAFMRALQAISGKDIGDDAELWQSWWLTVKDKPFVKAKTKPGRKTVPGLRYYDLPIRSSRLIFVLDVSRSMSWNDRLTAAKEEIVKVLERLPPKTRFNVIMYSDHAWSWKPQLTAAKSGQVKSANGFVRSQRPVNGTNAYDALAAAFRDPDADTIFFLSDGHPSVGAVTDPDLILLQVRDWNRYRRVRIHAIALMRGEPPAAFRGMENAERATSFMRRLADENDGLFKEVR